MNHAHRSRLNVFIRARRPIYLSQNNYPEPSVFQTNLVPCWAAAGYFCIRDELESWIIW